MCVGQPSFEPVPTGSALDPQLCQSATVRGRLRRKEHHHDLRLVKWLDAAKGFGFIQPEGGLKDASVHMPGSERAGTCRPDDGHAVPFDPERDPDGRKAATKLAPG